MKNVATTLGDFLRRIAFDGFNHGYIFYGIRSIPKDRNLLKIDQKLIEAYGVTRCRMTRKRQREKGIASIQYLRNGRSFVLMGTDGRHPTFSRIATKDARDFPLHFAGYTVGFRNGVVTVEVEARMWRAVSKRLSRFALYDYELIQGRVNSLSFYRFEGVEVQKRSLVKRINKRRKTAGLPLITLSPRPERQWRKRSEPEESLVSRK